MIELNQMIDHLVETEHNHDLEDYHPLGKQDLNALVATHTEEHEDEDMGLEHEPADLSSP